MTICKPVVSTVFILCLFSGLYSCAANSKPDSQLTLEKIVSVIKTMDMVSASPAEVTAGFQSIFTFASRKTKHSLFLSTKPSSTVSLSLRYQKGYGGKGWLLLDGKLSYTAVNAYSSLVQIANNNFGPGRAVDTGTGQRKWVWQISDGFQASLEKSNEVGALFYLSVLQGEGP